MALRDISGAARGGSCRAAAERGCTCPASVVRGGVEVRYADFQAGLPATIRLRASPERRAGEGTAVTDLTIRLSQVDINEPLGAEVFLVDVPADASPMTLEQLREAGPLGR